MKRSQNSLYSVTGLALFALLGLTACPQDAKEEVKGAPASPVVAPVAPTPATPEAAVQPTAGAPAAAPEALKAEPNKAPADAPKEAAAK